jgi:hypothetical protein
MKLYERFGDKGFHTSFVTTFGIDFDAYENIALSRYRVFAGRGATTMPSSQMRACSPTPLMARRFGRKMLGATTRCPARPPKVSSTRRSPSS